MSLARLQSEFFNYMTDAKCDLDYLLENIAPHSRLTSIEQLNIYKTSFFVGLQKNLEESFEVCKLLVGDEFFDKLTKDFISANNYPKNSNMNSFGDKFADFITRYPHTVTIPYLADIARLEWEIKQCLIKPRDISNAMEVLAKIDSAQHINLKFKLNSTIKIIQSSFPLDLIYEANKSQNFDNVAIDLFNTNKTYTVLIWQYNYKLHMKTLTAIDIDFFALISNNLTLGDVFQNLALKNYSAEQISNVFSQNIEKLSLKTD